MRSCAILAGFALCLHAATYAQVQVDNAIILEGSTDEDRQVHGLAITALPEAVLTAGIEGSGVHRFLNATNGPAWVVDLPSLASTPAEGLHLLVRSDGEVQGALSLAVNGLGPYPITRGPNTPVLGEEMPAGTVLSLVFDGTGFQLINGVTHARRMCPASMVAVTRQFCIEPTERDTMDFFEATLTCVQAGLRLCSWGESIIACENAGTLGLQQMTGNYEWTDDAANEDGGVRITGSSTCRQAAVSVAAGSARNFRCCLSR